MKLWRQALAWLILVTLLFTVGCGKQEDGTKSNLSTPTTTGAQSDDPLTPEELEDKKNFANSSPENDTDIGLKNVKIDTAEWKLTEEQKAVLEYFDDDYLSVPSYEFLRRYPNVFQGAQMTVWGTVKKVISMDNESYKLIFWLNVGAAEYAYPEAEYDGQYLILTGKTGSAWYMEGDTLEVYGRYTGVETVEVDGASYTIPTLNVYSAYFDKSQAPNDIYRYIQKFDMNFVQKVATSVFGNDIEVRKPVADIDVSQEQLLIWSEVCGENATPCFVVELENQSNAKFTKFLFYTGTNLTGDGDRIAVGKDATAYSAIERSVEFAADFKHFFLFTYDTDLGNLTLEYYDSDLKKIWKREFAETTSALYDYTKNNIYLVANNELYIINIETGEDTFRPAYVGPKMAIRKLKDGILMISQNKSDGVMKSSLDGSVIWKTNLKNNVYDVEGVQLIGDNIVFKQYYRESESDYGTHYVVLNSKDGSVIEDAVSIK